MYFAGQTITMMKLILLLVLVPLIAGQIDPEIEPVAEENTINTTGRGSGSRESGSSSESGSDEGGNGPGVNAREFYGK